MPLLNGSQLEYIFGEYSNEDFSISFILIDYKIFPFFSFLIDERNSIDIEQE